MRPGTTTTRRSRASLILGSFGSIFGALLLAQCSTHSRSTEAQGHRPAPAGAGPAVSQGAPAPAPAGAPAGGPASAAPAEGARDAAAGLAAWDVVYRVLQHPRCLNCHPAGDAPLQFDTSQPHAQNVRRGPDGMGLFAMRCDACHQADNLPGAHLPPGAPKWHVPSADAPLVFEGKSARDLALQVRDPAKNGGKSPAQLLEHASDPLVMWGWSPGSGRAPVPTPHDDYVRAVKAWIDAGMPAPER